MGGSGVDGGAGGVLTANTSDGMDSPKRLEATTRNWNPLSADKPRMVHLGITAQESHSFCDEGERQEWEVQLGMCVLLNPISFLP